MGIFGRFFGRGSGSAPTKQAAGAERPSPYFYAPDYDAPPRPDQQGPHGAVIPPNPNWNIKINNGWVPLPSDARKSK